MTPLLRLVTRVEATIDANGDAEMVRTWSFRSASNSVVDLSDFAMSVDVTTLDADIHEATDAAGNPVDWSTQPIAAQTRITCRFSRSLSQGEQFDLVLKYRHPRYLIALPKSDTWILHEYFERRGPLTDVDFDQEEPQRFEFRVHVEDPRKKILLWKTPWRRWRVETPQQTPKALQKGHCSFMYQFGLRPHDRPYDVHIVSSIDDRSIAMATCGTALSAVAAVIIERVLASMV